MRKYFLILMSCIIYCSGEAQQYYNEWVDYAKTYYKFKIGTTGYTVSTKVIYPLLYRILPQNNFNYGEMVRR